MRAWTLSLATFGRYPLCYTSYVSSKQHSVLTENYHFNNNNYNTLIIIIVIINSFHATFFWFFCNCNGPSFITLGPSFSALSWVYLLLFYHLVPSPMQSSSRFPNQLLEYVQSNSISIHLRISLLMFSVCATSLTFYNTFILLSLSQYLSIPCFISSNHSCDKWRHNLINLNLFVNLVTLVNCLTPIKNNSIYTVLLSRSTWISFSLIQCQNCSY